MEDISDSGIKTTVEKPRRFLYIPKPLLRTALALGITLGAYEVFSPSWQEGSPSGNDASFTAPAPKPPESLSKLQVEDVFLKEDIENRYGVKIITVKDRLREEGKIVDSEHINEYTMRLEWDKDRLQMLDTFLKKLPPHLYKLGGSGYELRIVLTASLNQSQDLKDGHLDIDLQDMQFTPDNEAQALQIYTHENTHALNRATSETYFDQIKTILGYEDYSDFARPLLEKGFEIWEVVKKSDLPDEEKKKMIYIYSDLTYGFMSKGTGTPHEFVSIMTRFYLDGRRAFTKAYSDFFDTETINKLYEFTKDNIFDGREYESQIPIPSTLG